MWLGSILRVLNLCGFVWGGWFFHVVLGLEMLAGYWSQRTPFSCVWDEAQVCVRGDVLLPGDVPWWLPIIYMLQGTLSLPFLVHCRCFNLHFQSPYSGSKEADSARAK